jgi:hypothetical protein
MAETFKREDHYGPPAHGHIIAVGVIKPSATDTGDGDYERNLVRITRTTYAAGVGLWVFAISCMVLALGL